MKFCFHHLLNLALRKVKIFEGPSYHRSWAITREVELADKHPLLLLLFISCLCIFCWFWRFKISSIRTLRDLLLWPNGTRTPGQKYRRDYKEVETVVSSNYQLYLVWTWSWHIHTLYIYISHEFKVANATFLVQ